MAKKKSNCRNCPDEPEPIKVIPIPRKAANAIATHGAQLWQQSMFTLASVLEMLHGYTLTGVSGDNLPQLRRMSERLTQIIQNCENRNADPSTP